MSSCFVATGAEGRVAGFYTFAAASIPAAELPQDDTRKLPRYPMFPAALIGRLAVDRLAQGEGLGGDLLVDAIHRATRADQAIFTLLVEAKNETAAGFYRKHGFLPLATRQLSLFLTLARAAALLRA